MINILSLRTALHLLLTVSLALQPLLAWQPAGGACVQVDRQSSNCGGCGCCRVETAEGRCGCCSDDTAPLHSAANDCEGHRQANAGRPGTTTPLIARATAILPKDGPAGIKADRRDGCRCGQLPQPLDDRAPLPRSVEHRADTPAAEIAESFCDLQLCGDVVRCEKALPPWSMMRFSQLLLCVWRL